MAHRISDYALILSGISLVTYVIYQALFSPLRSIPGPLPARFSRLWFLLRTWRGGRMDLELLVLHEKHGPVVRYGPYHYSFNDPDAIAIIYGKGSEFDKSSWYEAWNAPGFKTLFTEPSVKAHGQLRRKFQSTYTMSSMVHYETFADRCIDLTCKRLEEISDAGGKTDLSRWLFAYAADAVSMITYSRRMGFLDAGEDVGDFSKTLDGNTKYGTLVGIYSELHSLIFKATEILSKLNFTKGSSRMYLSSFNANLIEEKRAARALEKEQDRSDDGIEDSAPKDFLTKFLEFHEKDSDRFTERDINIGLAGNIIAGSDTTASALTGLFYCLLKNQTALGKLRDEITLAVEQGRLSSPPVFKEAQDLSYLQAVIQESLRMYPPVGLPLQREVPAGGAQINGRFFPTGTVVGAHILALHRNKSIWGDDAYQFRPERWLEADKPTLSMMQKYWAPFGLGTRTCIGKNISILEISKFVPTVLQKFHFDLADGLERGGVEMEWINRWFVRPVKLPVVVRVRKVDQ